MGRKKKDYYECDCDYAKNCGNAGVASECADCERNMENWDIQDNFREKSPVS